MNETGLSIHALEKTFGGLTVVRGLDLALARGEIVSLLGPSGCGKTTALRMVAGLERPSRGTITIGDRIVFGEGVDLPPERRGIGMVFQSYAVWPHRTVRENVAYPLRIKKAQDWQRRADEALELVHLPGFGDRAPGTLSGGQQQRVALARALVSHPALLLFDEPLSNLDAKLREEMRHEIRELVLRTGITSLYVTHDQSEAFAVSDRIAVVLGGRIAQIDRPEVIYEEPVDLAVAEFVGRVSVLSRVRRVNETHASIAGLATVPATFAAGVEPNVEGKAAVRPEALTIIDEAAAPSALPGQVLRSTFLGDRRELVVGTEAGELKIDVDPRRAPEVGSTVRLRLRELRMFA